MASKMTILFLIGCFIIVVSGLEKTLLSFSVDSANDGLVKFANFYPSAIRNRRGIGYPLKSVGSETDEGSIDLREKRKSPFSECMDQCRSERKDRGQSRPEMICIKDKGRIDRCIFKCNDDLSKDVEVPCPADEE